MGCPQWFFLTSPAVLSQAVLRRPPSVLCQAGAGRSPRCGALWLCHPPPSPSPLCRRRPAVAGPLRPRPRAMAWTHARHHPDALCLMAPPPGQRARTRGPSVTAPPGDWVWPGVSPRPVGGPVSPPDMLCGRGRVVSFQGACFEGCAARPTPTAPSAAWGAQ